MLPTAGTVFTGSAAYAQSAARQIGTVKSVSGGTVTISTDKGESYTINVQDGAHIVQLAPGSTDLKSAQPATVSDIAVGDRVLAVGQAGSGANTLAASRVVLMKSSAIAQKNAAEQADWQRRGMGGIVKAVDGDTITIASGAKEVQVHTSGKTVFRRYADDSVQFQNARPGTLAQVRPGDQLEVRGDKSADGSSMTAEEIVSGSFRNLSGLLATVDAASGTVTLKDLATKKMVTVKVTPNSDLRSLPPQLAARFAARAHGGGRHQEAASAAPHGEEGGRREGRSAGMDLSRLLSRLPTTTLAQLHSGEAVMIVGSGAQGSNQVTAITLLTGVEPILTAAPNGSSEMNLSPWSFGGGAPEGGGDAGGPQ